MSDAAVRTTVDLSAYPDLVVIYLGMRVEEPRGRRPCRRWARRSRPASRSSRTACCCTSS